MQDLQLSIAVTEGGPCTITCAAKFNDAAAAISFNKRLAQLAAEASTGNVARTPLMARLHGIRHQLIGSRT